MKLISFLLLGALIGLPGLAAQAQAICTRSSVTVLRKNPSSKAEKSWVVTKYMPFLLLEVKNGWLKVEDLDGVQHYGRASDFSQKFRCVVIKSNTADTRQGPGPRFPYGDFKTLDRYTPLKRLDAHDGWVQVENDLGLKSWVQESKVWHPVKVQTLSF
jgi:SH3-like domain-containing protein